MEKINNFWKDLDELIESVSKQERIVTGADLNEHVGIGDEQIIGGYGSGTRNNEIMNKKRVNDCGFCEKDGFGDCQYLFQKKR